MNKTINSRIALLLQIFMSIFVVASIASAPVAVTAVDITPSFCSDGDSRPACQIDSDQSVSENVLVGPNGIITRVARVLVWVSGALSAILVIISGLMFVFSGGNPESTGKARNTLLYAIIGVVVAVVAQLIVSYILEGLGS